MYTCEKCKQVYAEQVNICTICGHDVIIPEVSEPVFIPVSAVENTNSNPEEVTIPQTPGGIKAKGIVGFVLATECFSTSIFLMIYATLLSAIVIGYGSDISSLSDYGLYTSMDLYVMMFTYLFMAIAEVVVGIVSLSLISKAKNSGYTSRLTSIGKTFGIIGTVISAVSALLLFWATFCL